MDKDEVVDPEQVAESLNSLHIQEDVGVRDQSEVKMSEEEEEQL